MPFTVQKALHLEAFSGCSAKTASIGMHNEIRWVNILELLDDLRYIEEGDFLITTAYDIDFEDLEKQERLMALFAGKKLAAMALQTGHYIAEIPPSLIELAEAHGIPLIEIPHDTSFKSLTKALLSELTRQNEALASEASHQTRSDLQDLLKQGRFLMQKLLAGENAEGLRERLKPLRISPHADFYLVLVSACPVQKINGAVQEGQNAAENSRLEQSLVQLLAQRKLPFLVGPRETNLAALIHPLETTEAQTASHVRQLVDELSLLYPRTNLAAGMSRCHSRLEEIGHALAEARRALETAELGLAGSENLISYNSLGPYRLLLEVENLDVLQATVADTIGPLLKYDRRSNGALVTTLNSYLKHLNMSTAAAELYVHRHTLRYRLKQIEELTGFSLDDTAQLMQLYLALKVYDYLKARKLA